MEGAVTALFSTLTLESLRAAVRRWPDETVEGDNVVQELVELVKAGDEAGFRALAACVMPLEEVGECWAGTRERLGLSVGME